MRILMVQPAPFEPGRLGLENACWLSEPVAFTSLAAMVPEHDVRILDMRLEEDGVFNRMLVDFRPDLVATTSMTTDCYQAKALLECAKSTLGPGVFTIVGGHHPTLAPEDFEADCIDALCIGEGEETFAELVAHLDGGGSPRRLQHIAGLRFLDESGRRVPTPKRAQNRELDTFPAPRRDLVAKYSGQYFFMNANPMASISTSRGCSYDCNFCAIWEFYERRTRFLSAARVCDMLEQIEEKFVFFLDDNFLTNRRRIEELVSEIERRGIKKYWATQGRSDFVVAHPDVMKRLRDAGLTMLVSGYETNDEKGLAALKKSNAAENNKKAAAILNDLGIVQFGIFMVRPDFDHADFDFLYEQVDEMGVTLPIITVHTPLPGTQLRKKMEDDLVTKDIRFFDLLHAVVPTKLPRAEFYDRFTENFRRNWPHTGSLLNILKKRPDYFLRSFPGLVRWIEKAMRYQPVCQSGESHLRDEIGIIDPALIARPAKRPRSLPLVDAAE